MVTFSESFKRVIFYAPNVHSGGGLVLMKDLLEAFPRNKVLYAILDARSRSEVECLNLTNLKVLAYIRSGLLQKIYSEILLWRISPENVVIAFHNIPPILCRASKIFVFFQNRLLVENKIANLVLPGRLLLIYLERFITYFAYRQNITYITQTESMKMLVLKWLKGICGNVSESSIVCLPFSKIASGPIKNSKPDATYDFLYVSSAEPYKNHLNLFHAWGLLDKEGINPILAVTMNESDFVRLQKMTLDTKIMQIINLGVMSHAETLNCYSRAKAFIFPSLCESLSQPLIEARAHGLPIIASEADYVRDICDPSETFDPLSPLSISRAVKRYMCIRPVDNFIYSPFNFWQKIIFK